MEKPQQAEADLKRFQKRYDELSGLVRGLYENLVSGLHPERQYKQLMKQYDDEQAELEGKIEKLEKELSGGGEKSPDIEHFIALIRRFKSPDEVSDTMLRELVDKIVVHEAQGVGNARTQQVDIYFNYAGQVDLAYSEEELAEIKAQEEQLAAEKSARRRAREKAARERRKAKKIAENGGEMIVKKVCPHCGKEFVQASNRQIFCSKECRCQAGKAEKKAEREAERGGHYYRQRKCAVCGKLFWPNSSSQALCSEECRRKYHNGYSLEWWQKKQAEKELREVV